MAKKNQVNGDEKQSNGGRKNKEGGGKVEVVLKVDLHCRGCAGKVVKAIRSFDGVESVKIGDIQLNKITVIGEVDPEKLRLKVEEKVSKKVELISPSMKKVKFVEDRNQLTAAMKDEMKPNKLPMTTAVLKVPLHCQGCIEKIQKLVSKTKGFVDMSIDTNNDLVKVNGRIDMNALKEALEHKLKREVEIVPRKMDGGSGGKKKGKGGGDDGEGKESGSGGKKKGKGGGDDGERKECGGKGSRMEEHMTVHQGQYMYPQYVTGPDYMYNYMYATQMFNDENPNACVVL